MRYLKVNEKKADEQEKEIWGRKSGEEHQMPILLFLGGDEFTQQFLEIEQVLLSAIEKGECRLFIVSSYLSQSWEKEYTLWPAPSLINKIASF